MRSVAIVGNGPTAAKHGAEIDACDVVVRCNDCRLMGKGAGERIDALAWFACRGIGIHVPPGLYEHWITLPPHRCWPPNWEHIGGWIRIVDQAEARAPIRWITDRQWQLEEVYVGRPPSCGFTAVHLAMLQLAPCRIAIYGFDATTPDKPHYDDLPKADHHDFAIEKLQLAALRDHRRFLGDAWDCELVWIDPPKLDPAAVRKAAGL